MPPAPGFASITIGWPRSCAMLSTTTRLTVSEALPAGNGLMTLIGRVGQLSASAADVAIRTAADKAPTNGRNDNTRTSQTFCRAESVEPQRRRATRCGITAPQLPRTKCEQLIAAFGGP